jgi:hypothetical protein
VKAKAKVMVMGARIGTAATLAGCAASCARLRTVDCGSAACCRIGATAASTAAKTENGKRPALPAMNLYNGWGIAASPGRCCSIAALSNGQSGEGEAMTRQAIQTYYHGTRAQLRVGDLIVPGFASNFGNRKQSRFVYLSATLDAATWGAELAVGDGPGRIYIVEPTGPIEDDPNLTNTRFPGNPTQSYRSRHPFRVVGEVLEWSGHSPEQLASMRAFLREIGPLGADPIED